MTPVAGSTCLFEFTTRFATLNGVYRVRAQTTFQSAIASGVDFVENLYTLAGMTVTDFNADYDTYRLDTVLILESIIDNTVTIYTPTSIFAKVPDPTIREYYPLVGVIDFGVHKNTQVILPVIDQIKDLVRQSLGTTNPLRVVTNPDNRVYLTDAQYAIVEDAREANIEYLAPLREQLKNLEDANTILAARCAAYEALIASLSQ